MRQEVNYKDWERDFRAFLDAEEVELPEDESRRILSYIERELNPSPGLVFARLSLIGILAGMATLFICPQFGFGKSLGIMVYFMNLGPVFCRMACGGFFIGTAVLASVILFRPEEIRVLRRTAFLQISTLTLFFPASLICFGPEALTVGTLLWALGGLLGGLTSLEIGYRLRLGFNRKVLGVE